MSRPDQRQPYQGFPYVNPARTEARSLTVEELADLAKWQNLPRKPLGGKTQNSREENPALNDDSKPTSKSDLDVDSTPVVYIDIPQGSSGITDRITEDNSTSFGGSPPGRPSGCEKDRPVVYIDIPESNGSDVSQTNHEDTETDFVQETIFYDQFKDRRIEMRYPESEGSRSPESNRVPYRRPEPPRHLNIASPESSGFGSGSSNSSYTQNTYLGKETLVYGHPLRDEFSLSPLPVNDTPYPPPYEEIDQNAPAVPNTTPIAEHPRTQVITVSTPTATDAALDSLRKVETCQHCNTRVTTLVIKENGLITHLVALMLVWMLPLIVLYYMFGCCRYRNHYCPTCNRRIGYQYPEYCCIDTFHFDS
ncbi:hypothetical protein O0L34_g15901 [Tuta absoluta]|nr:hypothetical protein O0L34_g15901 [Tuta absoluta]